MFHDLPESTKNRMRYFEELDIKDRTDGPPRMKRFRQKPSETGKFISFLATIAPKGVFLELYNKEYAKNSII